MSSVFDPLEYISPFVLTARRILQKLCKRKVWDDELLPDILVSWKTWLSDLPKLGSFSMRRSILPAVCISNTMRYELHAFCDASYKGYGVKCYVRVINSAHKIYTSLLMAKTRLA